MLVKTHSFYALSIALPGLVIWGFGIQTIALGLLVKNRTRLDSLDVKTKFGFLYIVYKPSNFFWELIILYRTIAIAFTSVKLDLNRSAGVDCDDSHPHRLQPATEVCTLREFATNRMETRSIIVAGFTIY